MKAYRKKPYRVFKKFIIIYKTKKEQTFRSTLEFSLLFFIIVI